MSHSTTDAQLQNWENFCHHLGDWHGIWTIYNSEGNKIDSFKCIRSFQSNAEGSEIYHQNHYYSQDGETQTQNYGPYKKPITRALYLENSFSWGSQKIEPGFTFRFETGFRHESSRGNAVVSYDENRNLQSIIIISEYLENFGDETTKALITQKDNWQGTFIKITPDWIVSSREPISWTQLEYANKDYLTLHFVDGLSISVPPQLENNQEFSLTTEWLVNFNLLFRGIRHFNASGFTSFNLETFN